LARPPDIANLIDPAAFWRADAPWLGSPAPGERL